MIEGFLGGLVTVLSSLVLGIGDPTALFFQLWFSFIASFISGALG